MNISDYQRRAMKFSVLESKEDEVNYGAFNLASEAGEVTGKFAKSIRDKQYLDINEVSKEMGDVLWCLACLADGLGLDLTEIAEQNLQKVQDRTERDVIAGSGDNR